MFHTSSFKKNGFTLAELLVVISIIGLLSSIVLVSTKEATEKAKLAAVLNFSAQVYHALGAYAVGIWDFDDQIFPTKDTSGYNNDCSCTNCPDRVSGEDNTPMGKGYALSFDGSDDYLDCGNNFSLQITGSVTIAAWVKTNANDGGIVGKQTDANGGIDFKFGGGTFTGSPFFRVYLSSGVWAKVEADKTYNDGQWHHLVAVANGSKVLLYTDGIKKEGDGYSASIVGTDTGVLTIGARMAAGTPTYLNGIIDEVRIYEEALTYAQIKKLYVEGAEKRELLAKE